MKIGTIVKDVDGDVGIIIKYDPDRGGCNDYYVTWQDGTSDWYALNYAIRYSFLKVICEGR